MNNIIQQHLERILHRIADDIKTNAISLVEDEKLVLSGTLRAAVDTKVHLTEKTAKITVFVGDKAKYGKYLHEGIKPHMPPIAPIREWVRRKGIAKDSISAAWNRAKQSPRTQRPLKRDVESRAIDSTAWAIAINMKKKGRDPSPFLKLAVQMTLKRLNQLV